MKVAWEPAWWHGGLSWIDEIEIIIQVSKKFVLLSIQVQLEGAHCNALAARGRSARNAGLIQNILFVEAEAFLDHWA